MALKEIEMAESLERGLGRVEGKLESFITLHTSDMQQIRNDIKESKTFLEGEVKHALNSHAKIKSDIEELKEKTFHCPIEELKKDVNELQQAGYKNKFLEKNPDIKKGYDLARVIKVIGIIMASMLVASSVIRNIMEIILGK